MDFFQLFGERGNWSTNKSTHINTFFLTLSFPVNRKMFNERKKNILYSVHEVYICMPEWKSFKRLRTDVGECCGHIQDEKIMDIYLGAGAKQTRILLKWTNNIFYRPAESGPGWSVVLTGLMPCDKCYGLNIEEGMKDRRLATVKSAAEIVPSSRGNDITQEIFSKPWLTILSARCGIEELWLL